MDRPLCICINKYIRHTVPEDRPYVVSKLFLQVDQCFAWTSWPTLVTHRTNTSAVYAIGCFDYRNRSTAKIKNTSPNGSVLCRNRSAMTFLPRIQSQRCYTQIVSCLKSTLAHQRSRRSYHLCARTASLAFLITFPIFAFPNGSRYRSHKS